ncbi:MAG TPA: carboxypeptidase-like regulatory domain-containing protein [Candidatus Eisenbacteria bacterium]|nr:carboxypeptidase-like regulatory domain-containing protein [Candidatus Eisenbacteria bacterium]
MQIVRTATRLALAAAVITAGLRLLTAQANVTPKASQVRVTVVDESGAVIPNCKIVFRADRSESISHTEMDGSSEVELEKGSYTVTTSKAGFLTSRMEISVPISTGLKIVLQVDQTAIVDGVSGDEVPVATSELPISIASEAMCGLKTYHDSLTLAFQDAVNAYGETLVTLQVLPSFQREYAITVKRTSSDISVYRTEFRKQLWQQLGPLHVSRTRQQCLEIANAAQIDTVLIPASTEEAQRLWKNFSGIDFQTHPCKKCTLAQDGTQYVIRRGDGASLQIQEVAGVRGLKSGNARLLEWVHSMLEVARQAQNSSAYQ